MIQIKLDNERLEKVFMTEVKQYLNQLQNEDVFWDIRKLEQKVCMSINTMKKHFFYNDDFPKYKVGGKWYFPAEETKRFLLMWLKNNGGK